MPKAISKWERAVRDIHAKLYLDFDRKGEFWNDNKEWGADMIELVAGDILKALPLPDINAKAWKKEMLRRLSEIEFYKRPDIKVVIDGKIFEARFTHLSLGGRVAELSVKVNKNSPPNCIRMKMPVESLVIDERVVAV